MKINFRVFAIIMIGLLLLPTFVACSTVEDIGDAVGDIFEKPTSVEDFEFSKVKNKEGYLITDYNGYDEDVVIPKKYNDEPIIGIADEAFKDIDMLKSIKISKNIISIGDSAFAYCSSLTSITIPDSVTSIGEHAFSACSSLESITVEEGNTVYKSDENCLIEIASNTLILGCKNSIIPNYVTSIGERAFYDCSSLKSITIPSSVTSIGDSAFSDCSSLESITLPFTGKAKDETSNTHFGYIFGAYSYRYNSSHVPTSLKTVVITAETSIDKYAFYECSNIESITIPDSITSIDGYAFKGCSSLNNIILPNSIMSIEDEAFRDCSRLTNVTLPNNITSIKTATFAYCSNLESVTIPNTVMNISMAAFNDCTKLTAINYEGTTTQWSSIEKDDGGWLYVEWDKGTADYTVYCTDGTVTKE